MASNAAMIPHMPKAIPVEGEIQALAATFARDVLRVVVRAMTRLVDDSGGRPHPRATGAGRLEAGSTARGRRSPAATEALARKVAAEVGRHRKGIRIDGLKVALRLTTAALGLPIKKALAAKLIRKRGQRRATTYLPAG